MTCFPDRPNVVTYRRPTLLPHLRERSSAGSLRIGTHGVTLQDVGRYRIGVLVLAGVILAGCGTATTTTARHLRAFDNSHQQQVAHLKLNLSRAQRTCEAFVDYSGGGETAARRSRLEKTFYMLGSNATIVYLRIAAIDLREAKRSGRAPRVSTALRQFSRACSAVSRLATSLDP